MSFKAHFLNVGHGDCTILEHSSGRVSVIDIHNGSELDDESEKEVLSELHWPNTIFGVIEKGRLSKNEMLERAGYNIPRTNPVEYLKINLRVGSVFRFILTHPDLDHMRGFAALRSAIGFENFWDTAHKKSAMTFNPIMDDETDWNDYQKVRAGTDPTVLELYRGNSGSFWSEGDADGRGDRIEILAPTPELVKDANENEKWNDVSYVLRVTCDRYSIILGGDAGDGVWNDIASAYGKNLSCDVLKASHHGRESGFNENAVKLMQPGLTVLSVGKKPETDAHQKYKKFSSYVWSTRWKGNVTVTIPGDATMNAESQYNNTPLLWSPKAA